MRRRSSNGGMAVAPDAHIHHGGSSGERRAVPVHRCDWRLAPRPEMSSADSQRKQGGWSGPSAVASLMLLLLIIIIIIMGFELNRFDRIKPNVLRGLKRSNRRMMKVDDDGGRVSVSVCSGLEPRLLSLLWDAVV
ncbi:hypothetical protein NHX12_013050 [Muraenolepis orangiensis]|uniref:Uncharacterized protein n=1 Tax=Muraenolepis orangiensis TaxID=630683 RepID=A0A9Q0DD55_9TELE|nr:hypothetical protein NHX12_013050 [Muraenolepis orangiensis]